MGKSKVNPKEVGWFIVNNIEAHPRDIVAFTANNFKVSRQTIYRYIKQMIEEKIIETEAVNSRNITYSLVSIREHFSFEISSEIDEETVWGDYVRPLLTDLLLETKDICHYGMGEIVNNALEHSGGTILDVYVQITPKEVRFIIVDNGIGIFTKIQNDFGLTDKRFAILELAKGKFTSDPSRHSGEGIFFTSRMFDDFAIFSDDLIFLGHDQDDWLLDKPGYNNGTTVLMIISKETTRTMKEIFDRFAPMVDGESGFEKTTVPVKLLQFEGEALVSRSQAKRLIARFEYFREVILDFEGVKFIGQPFADEVFRVFANEHPNTKLYPLNTNEDVDQMIRHVLAAQKPVQ